MATTNFDGNKILKRFGHLAAFNGQMARVEEIVYPLIVFVVSLYYEMLSWLPWYMQTAVSTSACAISLS